MDDLLLPVTPSSLAVAALGYVGFAALLFLGARWLPGIPARGEPLPDGSRRTYKLSGLVLFLITHLGVVLGAACFGLSLTPLLAHFWSLLVVANAVAIVLAGQLLLRGRQRGGAVGAPARRGLLREFWYGCELNPTLFGVDLKMFLYHPSLIGLGLLVAAFAQHQFEARGSLTPQMALFAGFWWIYLLSHYLRERFMLSIWDVIAEKLGFMLVWGDLVYVPFFYSLGGWWVLGADAPWSAAQSAGAAALFAASLWIFRSANWQKAAFKANPETRIWGRPARALGGRLLVSGWWGIGRKLNYTGEIGVYVAIASCAGLASPWPWLLPVSLALLLVHRAGRDERRCRAKYGALWEEYCRRARFRMLPGIY